MQKLWIISELFYPEETSTSFILTKIANNLAQKYDVEVICGEPVYDTSSSIKDSDFCINSKIKINRLKSSTGDKNNLISRLFRFVLLSSRFFITVIKKAKKEDIVFTVTNPAPFIPLIGIIRAFKKFRLVILVHDVFPENTVPAGIFSTPTKLGYKLLKQLFDRAYSRADKLIVLGRDMENVIRQKTRRYKPDLDIDVIENWGDAHSIFPKNKIDVLEIDSPFTAKIVFQYAGNLGRVQGLMELLQVINEVKNDQIVFEFIGEGAVKSNMLNYVAENNLKNVFFKTAYKRNEQNEILNRADIAIVTLAKGMYGLGVPSKTYNILMAGKPILFIGEKNSEIGLLVEENKIGYCFEHADRVALLDLFNNCNKEKLSELKIMGVRARKLAENNYTETAILDKFMHSLD